MAGLPGDFWVNDIGPPIIPTGFDVTNWDKMFLGPIPKAWPGIVKIEASATLSTEAVHFTTPETVGLPLAAQVQEIQLVDKGYDPAKVRATIMVWDRIQWLSLRAFMASVAPDVTQRIRPYYIIRHPATALLGISAVIVDGFTVHPPEDQTLMIDIAMTQWFPYLVAKNPLDGGAAAVVAAVAPDPTGFLA
jgi:hypothetical protein